MAKCSPRKKNDNLNEWKGIIAEVEALQKENAELRAQLEEFTRQAREVVEEKGADVDETPPVVLVDEGAKVTDEGTKVTDQATKVTDNTTKVTDAEDEKKLQEKLDRMTEENKLLKIMLKEGYNLVASFKKLLEENKQLKESMQN